MSKRVDTKHCSTAKCTFCNGLGSYVTDDFNYAPGVRMIVQVCTRCNNEAGLPLVQVPGSPVIEQATAAIEAAFPRAQGNGSATTVRRSVPTPNQIRKIGQLIAELEELGDTEIHGLVAARIDGYTFDLASKCITKLIARKAQRREDQGVARAADKPVGSAFVDVPEGHYATKSRTGNNDLDFWAVSVGKEGTKWAGFRFVDRVVGGHEDITVRGAERKLALEAIVAAGVTEAGILYGQTIGACFKCNRHLTRKYSRNMGFGPDCADKLGLAFDHAEYARSEAVTEEVAA